MKRGLILGSLLLSANAFALGGVNILTTPTASGLGNPVQQAEVSADSVFYNPAALVFLKDGHYIAGGSAFALTDYRSTIGGGSTEITNDNVLVIPNIQYIYKKGDRAYYIGTGSMGQGGILDPSVKSDRIKSMEVTYLAPGVVFGVAQQLNEEVSISLGGRYTYVYQNIESDLKTRRRGDKEADVEMTGGGVAPEVGVYYRPTEKLDLSAKYLFRTKIDQDVDTSGDAQVLTTIIDGEAPQRGDYPALLTTGASYKLDDKNKIFAGHNIIFEDDNYVYGGGYDDHTSYGNTYEYMLGYVRTLNEKFNLELGYTYVDKAGNDDGRVVIQELDAQVYGAAIRYKYNEDTEYLLALNFNIYDDEQSSNGEYDAYRRETTIGIGITKRFNI